MKVFIITSDNNRFFHPMAELTQDSCIFNLGYDPRFVSILSLEAGQRLLNHNNIKRQSKCSQHSIESDVYFATHIALWNICISLNEAIIITEHNALFLRDWDNPEFNNILNLSSSAQCEPISTLDRRAMESQVNRIQGCSGKDLQSTFDLLPNGASVITRLSYAIRPDAAHLLMQGMIADGYWYTDRYIIGSKIKVNNLHLPIAQEQVAF